MEARLMASQVLAYTTKELSKKTWPDFEKLFSQKNGWDFCWCMHFHRPRGLPKNKWLRTRAQRGVRNCREKRELVERGCAHGMLVDAQGEPVGWCQYGPMEELPRIDNSRKYRGLALEGTTERLWRITCGAVLKKCRKRGGSHRCVEGRSGGHKKERRGPRGALSYHSLGILRFRK